MKIAVCDDERECRNVIINFICERFIDEVSVAEYCCGEDLLASYRSGEKYDLIFFDVEMVELSGITVGSEVRAIDKDVMFIFITAHGQYVPDAFTIGAFQFLIKPLTREVFNREFDRAIATYEKKIFKYKIEFKETVNYLEIKDIMYIETYSRRLRAVTSGQSFEYLGKIGNEEKKLSNHDFVRCHQGYLVNMHHIKTVSKNTIILSNGEKVMLSKPLRNIVLERFNKFLSGCCI